MKTKKRKFINIQEAAEILGISVSTVRRGVEDGRFPAIRAGAKQGKILFDREMLLEMLRNEAIGNLAEGKAKELSSKSFTTDRRGQRS